MHSKTVAFQIRPATHKGLKLGLSIFNTLFTVTAFVHICLYVVQTYYDLSFFDVFYTIAGMLLLAFRGPDLIIDDNPFSRIVILYVMIVGAIFIPTNLSDLLALIRSQSKYDKPYQPRSDYSHVLIVGNFEVTGLRDFLREFFCEDHGPSTMTSHVVMLNPNEPSEELERLLNDPLYSNRVRYVKGSEMSFRALKKARAAEALACFVLSSRFSQQDDIADDALTVMRALSLKKFHKSANIFAQVLLPGNKTHFQILADHVLCIDEFKLGMLAQNCLAPGFSTMLYLLTTSIPDSATRALKQKNLGAWVDEYIDGATMEIYAVKLSSAYAGMRFDRVADRCYTLHRVLLFAVGINEKKSMDGCGAPMILMNPQDYVLRGGETAYLITTQSGVADAIAVEGVTMNDAPDGWDDDTLDAEEQHDFMVGEEVEGFLLGREKKKSSAMVPVVPKRTNTPTGSLASGLNEGEQGGSASPSTSEVPLQSARKRSKKDDLIAVGRKLSNGDVEEEPPSAASVLSGAIRSLESRASRESLSGSVSQVAEAVSAAAAALQAAATATGLPESVTDHVVICALGSDFPENLAYFVAPYRYKEPKSIVVLCPGAPSPEEWARLSAFQDIHHVTGTPLLRRDLRKAKIDKASRAIVLADPDQADITAREADANALLAVLNIQAMCAVQDESKKIFTMVEFIHAENMKFIGKGENYYNNELFGKA
ncbi:hypothetical protein HK104_010910 [Borealophlyctis nickersoniae]|nr:hypothetical protein HK104_010910 [Borealophlyctis nickersoniae]